MTGASVSLAPLHYDNDLVRRILRETRTIAMVGASPNWVRPSNFAMKYLQGKGYRVIPVNPRAAGTQILGEQTYTSLADLADAAPGPVEIVDIFRSSDAAGAVVDEAIALKDRLGARTVWMQLGVRNADAARRAEEAGLTVIMDRCVKIEYGRLFGEIGWQGVNSGIISAKRPRLHH
ncbi:MAG: CoA-binding protein [Rhodospirillales bacterium]|nr:CoA-binding protein [Rhodospirillales bacterium]